MKKIFISILSVLLLFGITGCSWFVEEPERSPEEIVREAFNNIYDVKSLSYNFYLTGIVDPPAGEGESYDFFISFEGNQD
ncbi:hypothetical protein GF366_02395, partial [Candidatus Peregrinibacteria bacterium]|nr:hypothetical protein [Candidatus Peregrinibacteria bacterium]